LPGGPILEESYGGLIQLLGWGRTALAEPLRREARPMDGTVVALAAGVGYFHWLLEALPAALHALAHEPDASLLLPRDAPRYVAEAIELLGVKSRRSDAPVRVERLVLVGRDPYSGFVAAEDVEIVRAAFLPKVPRDSMSSDRIYVSRRLDRRSPDNERDVEMC